MLGYVALYYFMRILLRMERTMCHNNCVLLGHCISERTLLLLYNIVYHEYIVSDEENVSDEGIVTLGDGIVSVSECSILS